MSVVNGAAVNVGAQTSLHDAAFNSFVSIPRSRIGVSRGNSIFNVLRSFDSVFLFVFDAVRPQTQGYFLEGCRPSPGTWGVSTQP